MKENSPRKRLLISGATSGIGRAAAIRFCRDGCAVTLIGRNPQKLENLLTELNDLRPGMHNYILADFEDPSRINEQLRAFQFDSHEQLILINNVGGPGPKLSSDCELVDYQLVFNKFMLSFNEVTRYFIPAMKAKNWGRIINILGTTVLSPIPGLGLSVIKSMTAAWAKALSVELGPWGITVNNVLPGPTDTPELDQLVTYFAGQAGLAPEAFLQNVKESMPLKRIADPSEIAAGIFFLGSDDASFITGTNLKVDGGYLSCL